MTSAATEPSLRVTRLHVLAAVLLGGIARAIPCFNDFWLDEVWTYGMVMRLESPLEVFTLIKSSNNNHLNSLLFYAIGERDNWVLYRIPSLLAGTGSIALAALVAGRRGRLEAIFSAWLVAACFALLHFSSEARGYALAVFFALAAFWALERYLDTRDRIALGAFATCVVLGTLAHLTTLFFYAGAVFYSAQRLLPRAGRRDIAALIRLHLVPLLLIAAFGWTQRSMIVGGGIPAELDNVLARSFGFTLGLPVLRSLALPYAGIGLVSLVLGLIQQRRSGDPSGALFLITIVLAPVGVIGTLQPEVIAVRYFLIGIAFYLILMGGLLAALFRAGGLRRVAGLALLALFLAGNALYTAAFLRDGRGGFSASVDFMAEHTDGPRIVVGSDHDFRNGMVLQFYGSRRSDGKRIAYVPNAHRMPGGPEWMIRHAAERPAASPAELFDPAGNRYTLQAEFDHAAISGFYWAVYRNDAPGSLAPMEESE